MSLNVDLKSINWKRHGNTALKVLMDAKTLGLIAFMGFTIYGISWDTVLRPSLEQMKIRDEAIQVQKTTLQEREALSQQFSVWEEQLKGLETTMIPIAPDSSAKVASVTESSEIVKLARGENRLPELPVLLPPHDTRSAVTLTPVGNSVLDLMQVEGVSIPMPSSSGGMGNPAMGGINAAPEGGGVVLNVEKYDYDLKVTGTYPALMDLLNELVVQKKLIKINRVVITKVANQEEPDAKDYPDYPLRLDMTVGLSIFLYVSNAPAASP